jgi:hypothetical protein
LAFLFFAAVTVILHIGFSLNRTDNVLYMIVGLPITAFGLYVPFAVLWKTVFGTFPL